MAKALRSRATTNYPEIGVTAIRLADLIAWRDPITPSSTATGMVTKHWTVDDTSMRVTLAPGWYYSRFFAADADHPYGYYALESAPQAADVEFALTDKVRVLSRMQ